MRRRDDGRVGPVTEPEAAVSWQCRVVQTLARTVVRPRLTLAGGVMPLRRNISYLCPLLSRIPDGVAIAAVTYGGVSAEWTRCSRPAATPTFIHFHGGGFVAGSPLLSRSIVSGLVRRFGSQGFSVDYRLAPEHPHPAATDDAWTFYRALCAECTDPSSVVILGESAGAALALDLCLKIGAASQTPPRALVLISPWLDLSLSGDTVRDQPEIDPGLPIEFMMAARRLYRPHGALDDPAASPLFAALRDLPPVLIQVGGLEVLRDDARRLARRLEQAGVPHRLEEWAGMHHV